MAAGFSEFDVLLLDIGENLPCNSRPKAISIEIKTCLEL